MMIITTPSSMSSGRRSSVTAASILLLLTVAVILPSHVVKADAPPEALVEQQMTALRWLYDTFAGPTWRADVRESWKAVLPTATATTFLTSACARGEAPFIEGVVCESGRISKIYLREVGLRGSATLLTYTTFFSKFPLTSFDFTVNFISGQLADDFDYENAAIVGLLISGNQISGSIPSSLFTKTIQTIDLSDHPGLSSDLPVNIEKAEKLRALYLRKIQADGVSIQLTEKMCQMKSLETLDISANKYWSLPDCFSNLAPTLTRLFLNNNMFTGNIPTAWCQLTRLEAINLSGNQFDGQFPECFATLRHLQHLDVIGTSVTGSFPTFVMTSYPDLKILHLTGFSGPVPDTFDTAHMPHIERIMLGGPIYNTQDPSLTLTGQFPYSIFNALNLTSLVIQNTLFEGKISSANFTRLRRLCEVKFMNNWILKGEFPASLFTEIWTTPIDLKTEQFPRLLVLNTNPFFTGPLPDLSATQIAALKDLNTRDAEVFQFRHCDFWGWIPNSMAQWIPLPSQHNILLGNPKLYFPVQEAMWNWTSNNIGQRTTIGKFTPWSAPRQGGMVVVVNGSFPYAASYKIAFFQTTETPTSLMTTYNTSGVAALWEKRVFTVPAQLLYSEPVTPAPTEYDFYGSSYAKQDPKAPVAASRRQQAQQPAVPRGEYYSMLEFTVPNVGEETKQLPAMVFIDGPFRATGTNELILVAQDASTMAFYNPKPLVTGVSRSDIRREGCARLTLYGSGFSNAPLPTIHLLSDSTINARVLVMQDPAIVSDTELAFTLPFANAQNFTSTFMDFTQGQWETRYPLVLYPAGLAKPEERSDIAASANIKFIETCPGSITPCKAGHTDDFGCPVQPMCGCGSRGTCLMAAGQQPTCSCDPFFNGTSCSNCIAGRFGKECLPCDCGHGKCELNSVDGKCTCDEWWMGSSCNVNKLALGVGVGVSSALLVLIACCLIIRYIIVARRNKKEKSRSSSMRSRSKSQSRSMEMPAPPVAAAETEGAAAGAPANEPFGAPAATGKGKYKV